jgi:hypothetical protein
MDSDHTPSPSTFIKAHFDAIVAMPWVFEKKEARLKLSSLNKSQREVIDDLAKLNLITISEGHAVSGPSKYKLSVDFAGVMNSAESHFIKGFESMWLKLPWKKASDTPHYKPNKVDIFLDMDDPAFKKTDVTTALDLAKKLGVITIDMNNPFRAERKSFFLATHPALCLLLTEKLGLPQTTRFHNSGRSVY